MSKEMKIILVCIAITPVIFSYIIENNLYGLLVVFVEIPLLIYGFFLLLFKLLGPFMGLPSPIKEWLHPKRLDPPQIVVSVHLEKQD